MAKPVLTSEDSSEEATRGTRKTLVRTLEALLRLAHPLMPFITEEIWQRVAPFAGKQGNTIMLQPYTKPDPERVDEAAIAEMRWLMDFVLGVRRIRGEMKILIPMAGLIDKEAELSRLSREIEKLQKDLARSEGKLANPNFVDKAPPAVVEKERSRVAEMQAAMSSSLEQRPHRSALKRRAAKSKTHPKSYSLKGVQNDQ